MRSSFRLAWVALAAILALLPAQPPPARAQARGPRLSVDVPVVEVTGRPGATSSDRVQVVNIGGAEAEVDVIVEDVGGDDRGNLVAVPRGIGQNSAAAWVTVTPANLTIGSSASAVVDIRVKVPVGTKAGGYYAAVTFATDDETPAERRPTHLLLVKIAGGSAIARPRLTGLSMPGISLGGSVRFDLRLENTGTIHAIGTGRISIRDTFGNLVTRLSVPSVVVLPGLERVISITWDSPPIAARLKATAEVAFGGGEPTRQTATGFSLIWWMAALTLAVLMLLMVALLRLAGVVGAPKRRTVPSAMPEEAVRAAPPVRPAPRPVLPPKPAGKDKDKEKIKPRVQPPPAPGPAMTRPPVPVGAPSTPDPSFWGPQEAADLEPVSVPEVPGEIKEPKPAAEPVVEKKPEPVVVAPAAPVAAEVKPAEEPEPRPEPLVLDEGAAKPSAPSRPVAVTPSARKVQPEETGEEVELRLDEEEGTHEEIEPLEEMAASLEEPWFEEPEEPEEEPQIEPETWEEPPAEEPPAVELPAEEPAAAEEPEEEPEAEEEPGVEPEVTPLPDTPLRPVARAQRPIRVSNLPPVKPAPPVPVARVEPPPEATPAVPASGGSAMALRRAEVALRMITGKPGETGAILDAGLDLLYTVRNDKAVVERVESEFQATHNKRKMGPLSLALFAVQSPASTRALLESYGTATKVVADRIRRAILACDPGDIRGHRSVIEAMPAARRASLGL